MDPGHLMTAAGEAREWREKNPENVASDEVLSHGHPYKNLQPVFAALVLKLVGWMSWPSNDGCTAGRPQALEHWN